MDFDSLPDAERRERMEYLADLLAELCVLAEREGCTKLPELLEQSRLEAEREAGAAQSLLKERRC